MKKIIYVVTSGEYSDYRVDAVYDNKKQAEACVEAINSWGSYGAGIEEYELNPDMPEARRDGYRTYHIIMDRLGNTNHISVPFESRPRDFVYFNPSGEMSIEVYARNEKHAVKIANEKRTRLIAENKWGINPE